MCIRDSVYVFFISLRLLHDLGNLWVLDEGSFPQTHLLFGLELLLSKSNRLVYQVDVVHIEQLRLPREEEVDRFKELLHVPLLALEDPSVKLRHSVRLLQVFWHSLDNELLILALLLLLLVLIEAFHALLALVQQVTEALSERVPLVLELSCDDVVVMSNALFIH